MTATSSGPRCDFCGNYLLRSMMGDGEDEGQFTLSLIPDRTLHFCADCTRHITGLTEYVETHDPAPVELAESGIHEGWPDGVLRRAFEDYLDGDAA